MRIVVKEDTVVGVSDYILTTEKAERCDFNKGEYTFRGFLFIAFKSGDWDAVLTSKQALIPVPGKENKVRRFIAMGRLLHPDFPYHIKGEE